MPASPKNGREVATLSYRKRDIEVSSDEWQQRHDHSVV